MKNLPFHRSVENSDVLSKSNGNKKIMKLSNDASDIYLKQISLFISNYIFAYPGCVCTCGFSL